MIQARRYLIAVAATLAASLLTWLFPELLAPMRLFFFWCAVLATAVVAGTGPAVLAIVLSVLGALLVTFDPLWSLTAVAPLDALRLGMFVLFAGAISFAAGLRRRAERRAGKFERRYRTLIEATPVQQAVWTATPDGRIEWSDAWLDITGLSKHDFDRGEGLRVVHSDDAARTWERWKTALETKTPYDDEIRVRMKDGAWRWFAIRAVPIHEHGRLVEWSGIAADIDEKKRNEQQTEFLSRASELLSSSLDHQKTLRTLARLCVPALGDWCAIHLSTGGTSYERVVVEHSDPARVHFVEAIDARARPSPEHDPIVQVIRTGKSHLVERVTDEMLVAIAGADERLNALRSLGFRSWIVTPMTVGGHTLGSMSLVHGESGRHYSEADLPFLEDLARRAATAIENARLFEEAETANRIKDEFLATLSHELRTPLTAITGWAHMLQGGIGDEQTRRLGVETIVRSAQTQAELIDDLLDLSRVVAGTLHLNVVTVDLASIAQDVLVAAKPAADAKELTLRLDESTPALLVRGDERRLRQIVWNLVTNAVKFSDHGGSVDIRLSMEGRNARLEVRDTGRGIDASFLPFVWDRFRQADSSTSRQHGGLGLGLAVVRHLVELHGGTVAVASEGEGRGAAFTVEIPLARLDAAAASALHADAKRETPLSGRKVLVVDDDADSRLVLSAMLRQQGADVTAADSVPSAMRAIERDSFAAIVSDLAMPGEDGYSLARRIRATSQVPLIAVSALASGTNDRQRALEKGFDDFIRKPVDPRLLAEVVGTVIASRNPGLQ
jgi:PAS domain S-box-containing protein